MTSPHPLFARAQGAAMSQSDLTTSEILTATSRQRFGTVGKARAAYVIALRLRQSHPGELTERLTRLYLVRKAKK